MAKKGYDPTTAALEALARAVSDPTAKVLFGSAKAPGFFNGSGKAVKEAGAVCIARGWLEPSGEWVGKGASKKEKYRLTAVGIHAVLEGSETGQLLHGLNDGLQKQVEMLKAIHEQVNGMLGKIGPLTDGVAALQRRLQPPSLEEIRQKLGASSAPAASPPPTALPAWLERVVPLAKQQRDKDRFQPISLPALFQHLRGEQPTLTIGQFHDGLRSLRDQGRIRLIPFTRAFATIDDPRTALFLDGEVMYYVDLP